MLIKMLKSGFMANTPLLLLVLGSHQRDRLIASSKGLSSPCKLNGQTD
jgi:hypothetical protein